MRARTKPSTAWWAPAESRRIGCRAQGIWLVAVLLTIVYIAPSSAKEPDTTPTFEAVRSSAVPAIDSLLVEPSDTLIEASAGRPLTLVFHVQNRTGRSGMMDGRVELPEGWRLLIPPLPVRIPAHMSHSFLLSAMVPRTTRAGNYVLRFTTQMRDVPAVRGETDLRVVVQARKALQIMIVEAPEFVAAGEEAILQVRVTNTGNVGSRVRLSVLKDGAELRGLPVTYVEGGESIILTMPIVAPESSSGAMTVRAVDDDDRAISARRMLTVPVVSRPQVRAGYHRLPAEATIRLPGSGTAPRPQVVLSASGSLFDEGEEHVDLFIRSPSQRSVGIYGRPDLYSASYRSDAFDIRLGDHVYAISPLTTSGASFFGAQAEARLGPAGFGAVVNRSRRQFFEQGQQSIYARYGRPSAVQTSLHLLNRTGIDAGQIATVRGLWHRDSMLHIDGEVGVGRMEAESGTARQVRIGGDSERFTYDLRHEHMGPSYPSSQRGRTVNTLRLAWEPRPRVQLYGHYFGSSSDYSHAGISSSVHEQSRVRFGGRYRHARGDVRLRGGASAERAGRLSSSAEASLRGTSLSLRTELGIGYRAFGFHSSAELGSLDDDLTGDRRPFQDFTVQTSFQPSSNQGYNIFLHYFNGARMHAPNSYRSLALNASAYYRPGGRTTFRVRSSTALSRVARWHRGMLVQADVEHRLANGHSVELSVFGQRFLGSKLTDGLFLLSYRVPLEVPLTPSRVDARLVGRIVDVQHGIGLADVRVLLGDHIALTDDGGAFEFIGVEPGSYRLTINRADLGLEIVPIEPLPIDLTLRAGERQSLQLDVTRGGSISGKVELFESASEGFLAIDTTLVSIGGLRNVMVDLVRDSLRIQQVTDRYGEFRFFGLTPGVWTLHIHAQSLPSEHVARPSTKSIDLPPGESAMVLIDVVPRPRRIRFIEPKENE